MAHRKLPILDPAGFVVLGPHRGPSIPPAEWNGLEFIDWKSGGDTNFAPLASALGEMECHGFWDHGKPDKDGIWTKNQEIAPSLVRYVEPVSYTHLDVYKRQAAGRAPAPPRTRPGRRAASR